MGAGRGERVGVLLLAAGRGERLGAAGPKAFVQLAGRTLIDHAVGRLLAVPEIDLVQPVVPADAVAGGDASDARVAAAVEGGAERQDSVAAGLASLPEDVAWVGVHDAARCLVSPRDVQRTIGAARAHGAAILARPATDTIKLVGADGVVAETLERARCWAVQTPQVFRADVLREAHAKARAEGFLGTDDAQLVERLGVAVHVVEGGLRNLKITHAGDLALAAAWLAEEAGGEGGA